jgi:hypothetical protein
MNMLNDASFCRTVIAILVSRDSAHLDGITSITQEDLDAVAYNRLLEGTDENGNLLLKVETRKDLGRGEIQ